MCLEGLDQKTPGESRRVTWLSLEGETVAFGARKGLWPPFTHRFCDTDRTNVLYLPGVMGTRCVSSAPKDNLVSCNV